LAVFGAHMRGLPLCSQLETLGGCFLREDQTAPVYRMFALDAKRPGVIRVDTHGATLALEVWELPLSQIGILLTRIPSPLCLGTVFLLDQSSICGFLCETVATTGKTDITHFGGWRRWLLHAPSSE